MCDKFGTECFFQNFFQSFSFSFYKFLEVSYGIFYDADVYLFVCLNLPTKCYTVSITFGSASPFISQQVISKTMHACLHKRLFNDAHVVPNCNDSHNNNYSSSSTAFTPHMIHQCCSSQPTPRSRPPFHILFLHSNHFHSHRNVIFAFILGKE